MYVYIDSEPKLWTVGYHDPLGKWHAESDHHSREKAAERVHYLNGGHEFHTEEWEHLCKSILDDARSNEMTDMNVFCVWRLGLSAWNRVQSLGGRFPDQGGGR